MSQSVIKTLYLFGPSRSSGMTVARRDYFNNRTGWWVTQIEASILSSQLNSPHLLTYTKLQSKLMIRTRWGGGVTTDLSFGALLLLLLQQWGSSCVVIRVLKSGASIASIFIRLSAAIFWWLRGVVSRKRCRGCNNWLGRQRRWQAHHRPWRRRGSVLAIH